MDSLRLNAAFGDVGFYYTLEPGEYEVRVELDGEVVGRSSFSHPSREGRFTKVPVVVAGDR